MNISNSNGQSYKVSHPVVTPAVRPVNEQIHKGKLFEGKAKLKKK